MRVGERAGGWAARGVGHSPEIRGRPESAPDARAVCNVRRVYHLRRIGFYLHKEFRGGRIGFYLPKEFRGGRRFGFYLPKDFRGDLLKKSYKKKACIFKKFSRCAGNLFIVILCTQTIPGGDLVENRCFTELKLVNVCRFSDFDRGTMRQKMVIFKERNSVWGRC